MQEMWTTGLNWYEQVACTLEDTVARIWKKIRRWIHIFPSTVQIELHGFVDASMLKRTRSCGIPYSKCELIK